MKGASVRDAKHAIRIITCIAYNPSNTALSPDDFKIDKVYRFEGATNPDDQSLLYAISARKYNLKGVLVNGYGISSNGKTDDLISRLNTHMTFTKDQIALHLLVDLRNYYNDIYNVLIKGYQS